MSAPANLAPARGARTPEPETDAVDAAARAWASLRKSTSLPLQ